MVASSVLWTEDDEIRFFNLVCDFKPAGKNRQTNIAKIVEGLNESPRAASFNEADITSKLAEFWDMDRVEEVERSSDEDEGDGLTDVSVQNRKRTKHKSDEKREDMKELKDDESRNKSAVSTSGKSEDVKNEGRAETSPTPSSGGSDDDDDDDEEEEGEEDEEKGDKPKTRQSTRKRTTRLVAATPKKSNKATSTPKKRTRAASKTDETPAPKRPKKASTPKPKATPRTSRRVAKTEENDEKGDDSDEHNGDDEEDADEEGADEDHEVDEDSKAKPRGRARAKPKKAASKPVVKRATRSTPATRRSTRKK
ncbi:chromatin modification-related protein Eaf7p [Diutina catenulata]